MLDKYDDKHGVWSVMHSYKRLCKTKPVWISHPCYRVICVDPKLQFWQIHRRSDNLQRDANLWRKKFLHSKSHTKIDAFFVAGWLHNTNIFSTLYSDFNEFVGKFHRDSHQPLHTMNSSITAHKKVFLQYQLRKTKHQGVDSTATALDKQAQRSTCGTYGVFLLLAELSII